VRRLIVAAVGAAIMLVAGCGVSAQATPEPVQPPSGVSLATTQPPDASESGRTPEYLYFVKDGMVARIARRVTGVPSTNEVIHDLLAGPDDQESAGGYTSALLGDRIVDSVQVSSGLATVALTAPMSEAGRNDIVLAYAQLVCTLTAQPQIGGVIFTSAGTPISVPRGDGSLSQGTTPLTAADYTGLIGPA
jgi:spore germination protein GerM